eukprot:Awhi_evm1s10809
MSGKQTIEERCVICLKEASSHICFGCKPPINNYVIGCSTMQELDNSECVTHTWNIGMKIPNALLTGARISTSTSNNSDVSSNNNNSPSTTNTDSPNKTSMKKPNALLAGARISTSSLNNSDVSSNNNNSPSTTNTDSPNKT